MLYFSFSIPTQGFPHFYYMLGANLGLLLYGEVSVTCFSIIYLTSSKLLELLTSTVMFGIPHKNRIDIFDL